MLTKHLHWKVWLVFLHDSLNLLSSFWEKIKNEQDITWMQELGIHFNFTYQENIHVVSKKYHW
jgi:hypothetical protein